jgi:hypothetical protein
MKGGPAGSLLERFPRESDDQWLACVMKAACDRMDGYTDNQSNVFFSTS